MNNKESENYKNKRINTLKAKGSSIKKRKILLSRQNKPVNRIFNYSYLKASTGFMSAAFLAGYIPAAIPTAIETRIPIIISFKGKTGGRLRVLSIM